MNREVLLRTALILGLAATTLPGSASAFVLDATTDKAAVKLRADINKQGSAFSACLIKAAVKCESKGADPTVSECNIAAPATSTIADADAKAKFIAAVAKCLTKVDYNKANKIGDATQGYEALGCPGDCDANPTTPPRTTCTDLATWTNIAKASTPATVQGLAAAIPALTTCPNAGACATDTGACPVPAAPVDPMNPTKDEEKAAAAFKKCIAGKIGIIAKLVGAIQKCQTDCENDYKDKKGNGGPTDTSVCAWTAANMNANFKACTDKAVAKATKDGTVPFPNTFAAIVPGLLQPTINVGVDNLFNNDNSLCVP